MRPALRLLSTIIPVVALAACALPTAPEASQTSCLAGKVPYTRCANSDFVNPLGDFVNPLGDFVNPLGDDTTKTGG